MIVSILVFQQIPSEKIRLLLSNCAIFHCSHA